MIEKIYIDLDACRYLVMAMNGSRLDHVGRIGAVLGVHAH